MERFLLQKAGIDMRLSVFLGLAVRAKFMMYSVMADIMH